jgi:lysophospholipase L1-like esterase
MSVISKQLSSLVQQSLYQRESMSVISGELSSLVQQTGILAAADVSHKHVEVREFIISSQITRVQDPVIVVGDSVTEAAILPTQICGHSVINAGIGGAWASMYKTLLPGLFAGHEAVLIAIALGLNDSQRANARVDFKASYASLVDELAPFAKKLLFVGITPIEGERPLVKRSFDQERAVANDKTVRLLAKDRSVGFVDMRATMTGANLTTDGIHLTAEGYEKWNAALGEGISDALGCKAE